MSRIPNGVFAGFGRSFGCTASCGAAVEKKKKMKFPAFFRLLRENISPAKGNNLHERLIGITLVSAGLCLWVEIYFWRRRKRNTQSLLSLSRACVRVFALKFDKKQMQRRHLAFLSGLAAPKQARGGNRMSKY